MNPVKTVVRNQFPDVVNVTQEILDDLPRDKSFFRHGAYGSVQRIRWGDKIVAVKYYRQHEQYTPNSRELYQLASCNHENIVKVLGAGPDLSEKKLHYYIMEFADCGSLDFVLHKIKPAISYNLGQALNWALQCARGVDYLHSFRNQPIIHRDLKPANLLLFDSGRLLKLCDFGTAKEAQTENTAETGTFVYMAPEVMECMRDKLARYDEKCDIYSWAIILWEILSRQKPYASCCSSFAIVWTVRQNNERPDDIPGCPQLLQQLIHRCWHSNPRIRPPMRNVAELLTLVTNEMPHARDPLVMAPLHGDIAPNPTPLPSITIPQHAQQMTPSTPSGTHTHPSTNGAMAGSTIDPKHCSEDVRAPDSGVSSEIKQVYLSTLERQFRPAPPIENDEESQELYAEHTRVLDRYLAVRFEVDRLQQMLHDSLQHMAPTQEERDRIRRYCVKKAELEELRSHREQ